MYKKTFSLATHTQNRTNAYVDYTKSTYVIKTSDEIQYDAITVLKLKTEMLHTTGNFVDSCD